ncbi:hypothetical protein M8C13_08125 [Crossiella sp. SN42]|uniref:hypothetical protein n=1 Tax=Crossiella sp. SN42 TaxID=2944808 RepID=UPI00207D5CAF|nr:hypothetical protein [Crossiella sp. SN42]MCO1575726.1 hypothetical protein [Crossiella sp. SN42]
MLSSTSLVRHRGPRLAGGLAAGDGRVIDLDAHRARATVGGLELSFRGVVPGLRPPRCR